MMANCMCQLVWDKISAIWLNIFLDLSVKMDEISI